MSHRRAGLAVVTAGLILVALGSGLLLRPGPPRNLGVVPPTTQVVPVAVHRLVPAGLRSGRGGSATPPRPAPVRAAPVALRLDRLGVSARVVPVSVGSAGALVVPTDPKVVGWWQGGARPGSHRGSVVIDGHVDDVRVGAGALFTLRSSRPGDRVLVRDAAGHRWGYVVTGIRRYPKKTLPARDVFAQGGPERLVLITCGGMFDVLTRQYSDNVVVYAVPAKAGPR